MADTDGAPTSNPEASSQLILVLRNLLGERYPDLGKHVNAVAQLCEAVADDVGLPGDEKTALTQAAYLHDIGKLSIPESILSKPSALDDGEWSVVRLHTITGAKILLAAGLRGNVIDFVRSSHERFDGTGYPDCLAGEAIPLGARIIAVCDAYDAMTSYRPYRSAPMSREGGVLELGRGAGTQFDPVIVDAVCQHLLSETEPTSGTPEDAASWA